MASTHATRAARRIAARLAAGLLVAAGALGATAAGPAAAQGSGQPRVLVRAVRSEAGHAPLVRAAAERVSAGLIERGIRVVDAELAERLLSGVAGGAAGGGLEAWGETVLEVGLRPEQERRQQGRYRVRDRLTLRITRLDDAALLLEESEVLAGLSFDGLLAAHHEALDRILAAASPQSAVGRAAARLEALRAEEARDGARFAIVVHAGRDDRDLAPRLAAGLRAVPGVRADSVAPVRQDSAPLGDGGKQSLVEIRLRFQGASADLVAAVLEIVAGDGGTAEPPAAERPAVDFVATPRRLVVFVRPAPAGTGAVADESLEAAMSRGIDRLLERVGPGTGRGPSIAFAPAEVPAPAGRADERHAVLLQRLAKAAVSALAGKPAAAGVLPSPAAEPGRAAAAQVLVQPKLVKLGPRRLLSLAFLDAAGATPVVELGHVLAGADCTPSEPAGSGSSGRRRL